MTEHLKNTGNIISVKNAIVEAFVIKYINQAAYGRPKIAGIISYFFFLFIRKCHIVFSEYRYLLLYKSDILFNVLVSCCIPRINIRNESGSENGEGYDCQKNFLFPIILAEQIPEYKKDKKMFCCKIQNLLFISMNKHL